MKVSTKTLALLAPTLVAACTAIAGLPDVPPLEEVADSGSDASIDAGGSDATDATDATREEAMTTVDVDGSIDATIEDAADAEESSAFDAADGACSLGSIACAVQVTVGTSHACALLSTGAVDCWGLNTSGQLGNGTTVTSATPVGVFAEVTPAFAGLTGVVAVAAGAAHTCALLADGTVACWGLNVDGQLGNGTVVSSTTPVAVSANIGPIDAGLNGVTAIAAGADHTCALLSTGMVECWGLNTSGQLGNGTAVSATRPVPVSVAVGALDAGLTGAVAITAGSAYTCALLSSGAVDCWGLNAQGQLGTGALASSTRPVPTVGAGLADAGVLAGVSAVVAGTAHTCVLLPGGAVDCWGNNGNGQLGNGTLVASPKPVAVLAGADSGDAGLRGAIGIAAGAAHTCALLADGTVDCWGFGSEGELGREPLADGATLFETTPVPVPQLMGATSIAASAEQTCAILSGGAVECWGLDSNGQLGDGQMIDGALRIVPVPVPVLW